MNVDGKQMQPIWFDRDTKTVRVIDQRLLPHEFIIKDLTHLDEVIHAIQEMVVRGAPLIGATGGMGVYVILVQEGSRGMDDQWFFSQCDRLKNARPTATNLAWAVNRVQAKVMKTPTLDQRIQTALDESLAIMAEETDNCKKIGTHGLMLIREIADRKPGEPVNILTHCNAGWLACIEYGTATAPIYAAHNAGIPVHVWVDETRPLNQGARLTAWELGKHGIPHTVITDNAGGHLMQHGQVDLVIVGTDRTTRAGDVANKIGTYLKALAARDNDIPFMSPCPPPRLTGTSPTGSGRSPLKSGIPMKSGMSRDGTMGRSPGYWSPPKTVRRPTMPLM